MNVKNRCIFVLTVTIILWSLGAGATTIHLTQVPTQFNTPIGIDFHEPTGNLALSVNYPTGVPRNFELVRPSGAHAPFSNASGFTNEVKIATVRSGGPGGFETGALFTGNGVDGQIAQISADGTNVINPWVDLPGDANGLMRGSLHVDQTGVFGGDLIAATTAGQVWRVDSAGNASLIVDLEVHLEGLYTIPDSPSLYGPLAGRILVGAEATGLIFSIDPQGSVVSYDLDIAVEDIDLINANQNFFGVNFGTGFILTAPASDFATITGSILLTQEFPGAGGSGLYALSWDGSSLQTEQLVLSPGSARIGQWEHVTFAPFSVTPEPTTFLLLGVGMLGLGALRRRAL